jgi:hypothetical protein
MYHDFDQLTRKFYNNNKGTKRGLKLLWGGDIFYEFELKGGEIHCENEKSKCWGRFYGSQLKLNFLIKESGHEFFQSYNYNSAI